MNGTIEFCVRIRIGNRTVERIVPLSVLRAVVVEGVLRSAAGSRQPGGIDSVDLEMCANILAKAIEEARNG